jgi:hypothetical protein
MHPENGLQMVTEAQNMKIIWDPLPSQFTIRFDDIYYQLHHKKGPDSVDGTATRYGLEGPGIECRWGRDFPHLSIPALGPNQPLVKWVPGLSRGKGGRGVTLTTHPI